MKHIASLSGDVEGMEQLTEVHDDKALCSLPLYQL